MPPAPLTCLAYMVFPFANRRKFNQRCKVEKVYFFWAAGKAGAIEWFAEDLAYMSENPLPNVDVFFNIYARVAKSHLKSMAAERVPLASGRNDTTAHFKRMKKENPGAVIGVLICGPKKYQYQVRLQCLLQSWTLPWTTQFHSHNETFAF